ncbi:MAG: tRNA (N6-threonylcarbamoyladenosine(37)-N6)-methyltransferase TrmO [Syntrophomonadaceae bacterium]|jgi:tRNA-Thr(GGU) m(6)t(6)A37 methyltransferase TsaA|nr:tRNA (N6-threonylcarbamoyladenosine(37)-N6)-methyltransferase TrmO [Syntrophomonadaceae bacterium]
MDDILLKPIGIVHSDTDDALKKMPLGGEKAIIEVFPDYHEALQGIEENSHIWVLAWFHKAERDILKIVPKKVNPDFPEYGVFALRAFNRPNPIGMCLAALERVEGNLLHVSGLDAIGGTPVLDIKPYFEKDIVFSPKTSYIKGKDRAMRYEFIFEQAMVHHGEDCRDLYLASRMAAIAEDELGKLNDEALTVAVKGSSCLADCIQGITKARLANPARFTYENSEGPGETQWGKNNMAITLKAKRKFSREEVKELSDKQLFTISK